jgi:hypothetical protein
MKYAVTGLLIFVFGVLALHGQTNSQPTPPDEWSLWFNSWGAQWEKKFEVLLDQSGSLDVVEEDSSKLPNNTITKLKRKIPPNDLKQIYAQALVAVQDLPKSGDEVRDGSWMRLKLTSGAKVTTVSFHTGVLQEQAPDYAKLLSLINKHLPEEHHVY